MPSLTAVKLALGRHRVVRRRQQRSYPRASATSSMNRSGKVSAAAAHSTRTRIRSRTHPPHPRLPRLQVGNRHCVIQATNGSDDLLGAG